MPQRDPNEDPNLGVSPATNPLVDFNKLKPVVNFNQPKPTTDIQPNKEVDDWDVALPEDEPQDWDVAPVEAAVDDWDQPLDPTASLPPEDPEDAYSSVYSMNFDLDTNDEDDVFKPKTFDEFRQEQLAEDKDIDWLGWQDNSLVTHAIEWGRQVVDEGYIPKESIIGRAQQDLELRDALEELGPIENYDQDKRWEAEDIWEQRNQIKFKNFLDEQADNAEFPSLQELKDAVAENPGKFFKGMLQEMVNKPELLLIPELAAARGVAVAGLGAEAAALGARGVQVAKVVGGTTGAGVGGLTVGSIDRMLQQSTKKNEIDILKAMEQSQLDAVLGIVIYGGGRAITKGVNSLKRAKDTDQQAKEFSKKAGLDTATEMAELRVREKLQRIDEDPATETWIDENGNAYAYEVREVLDESKLKGQIKGLQNLSDMAGISKSERELLNVEIDRVSEQLKDNQLDATQLNQLMNKRTELALKAEDIPTREQAAKEWYTGTEKAKVINNDFMQVEDSSGQIHTLKRYENPVKDNLNVEGVQGVNLSGQFNVQANNNKLMEVLKNSVVSATSSLNKVSKMSPTAKLLMDTVNPRSKNGRSPINTISENTAYQQGQFTVNSIDIRTKMEESGVSEEAVRDHMRGVNISENPLVLEAAKDVRGFLDGIKDYAKSNGMKLDEAKDFLPRYYDQKKVTEEQADMISQQIGQVQASPASGIGGPKYNQLDARESIENIMTNTQRGSDEQGPITGSGKVQPIGYRKWKNVPDSVLAPIMMDDFFATLDRYAMNTAKRVELDKVFGPNGSNIEDWINKISKEVDATNAKGTEFGKRRALTEEEKESLRDIPKLLGGTYGGKSRIKGLTDGVLAAEMGLKLPLVTLTSILEPFTMATRLNESTGISDIISTYTSLAKKNFNGVPKSVVAREAKEVGLVHDAAVAERLDAMVGEGLSGMPAKASKFMMKRFMLHQWTEHTRTMAYQASRNDLMRSIKGLAMDPKSSKSLDRQDWLAEMNIDPKKAINWYNKGADVNDDYFETIKRGAARFTNTMIANPTKINKGKLTSSNNSAARLITQFKGFTNVYANDVVGSTLDEASKQWNRGNKVKALRKMSGLLATVSAMTYWTSYKTGLLTGEGVVGDDEGAAVAGKMLNGVTGMLIPGASMMTPLAEGYGLGNVLGPAAGDVEKLSRGLAGNRSLEATVKGIAPTYSKIGSAITDN